MLVCAKLCPLFDFPLTNELLKQYSGLFKQAADAVYLIFLKSVDTHSVSTHNKHSFFLHLDCCHKSFIEWWSGDFNITTCVQ